ncbi:MAG TPA: glycogen-binding domain-containing protein [Gemmatimonadaceae bacterium]
MMHSRWHWTLTIGLCATVSSVGCAQQMSQAAGIGASVPLEVGRFDVRAGGNVHRVGSPVGLRTPFSFEATARLRLNSGGLWVGSGFEGTTQVDTQPARALFSYGVWKSLNRIQVSIGATTRSARLGGTPSTLRTIQVPIRDTIRLPNGDTANTRWKDSTVGSPGERSRFSHWSDIEGRASWRFAALNMEAVVGGRPAVQSFVPALWGRLSATYSISDRFALVGAAGTEPRRLGLGLPSSNFVSLAFRIHPGRECPGNDLPASTSFALQPSGDGSYKISYANPEASAVELSGDFAGWRPIALTKSSAGRWETTLSLTPGTYHLNVRVNGGKWMPPPGLPQLDDDFNGAVGVLVVR